MNEKIRKMMDACPSYMVAEWALPALINGDYTGIIPMDAPESCGEAAMVAQFDEDVVQGRSIMSTKMKTGRSALSSAKTRSRAPMPNVSVSGLRDEHQASLTLTISNAPRSQIKAPRSVHRRHHVYSHHHRHRTL